MNSMNAFSAGYPKTRIFSEVKALAFIVLCGLLGFFGTLHSPFQYDDAHAIVENPHIKGLADYQEEVGIQNIFNRSVLLLSYTINREVGHLDVYGYHLVNILIHICVGVLLYFITRDLILLEPVAKRPAYKKLPLAAAAIHMFNPVTVESVAYISSRSSSLATLFYLLGFYFFLRHINPRESGGGPNKKFLYLGMVFLFFFLGIATKEIVITLPIMAFIYLWFRYSVSGFRKNRGGILLMIASIFIFIIFRYLKQGSLFSLPADPTSQTMERGLYLLTQIQTLAFYYLPKLFLPFNLNFEPDVRLVSGFTDPQWIAGLVLILILGTGLYLQKSRVLSFAFLWMFVTLLPTSSIIPLKQIASEHRTYLPGLGISLCLGVIFVVRGRYFRLVRTAMILFLVSTSLLTLNRSLDYRSEIALWEDTAKKSPNKALVRNNLATAYMPKQLYAEAIRELKASLRLDPNNSNAYINLGNIYATQERWREALENLEAALILGSQRAEVFYNSGMVRIRLNQPAEAIFFLKKAVSLKPHLTEYHFQLGFAYQQAKFYDKALKEFRITLQSSPGHVQAQNNIGVIFWKLKAYDLAEPAFKKALGMQDDLPKVHNNLASLYMTQKKFGKAVYHLERVIALEPGNAQAKELLKIANTLKGH